MGDVRFEEPDDDVDCELPALLPDEERRRVSARMSSRLTLRSVYAGCVEVSRTSVNLDAVIVSGGVEGDKAGRGMRRVSE